MTQQIELGQDNVVKGVALTSLGLILIRVFFFITSVITARVLTPDDFGIIGMAATITLLIDTTSANGIDNFLICKQTLLKREINTAFVLNSAIALLLTGLLILAAPLLADFYHQPKLNLFLFYAGLSFLVAMLGRIPRAFLIKEMRQGMLSIIDIVSNFVNFGLIIYLALTGFEYLSYVISLLVSQTIRTLLLFALSQTKFGLTFDYGTAKAIFAYSRSYLPQTMLSYCLSQADYIIGGVLLGTTLLGYYYFGFEKAFLVVMVVRTIAVQVFFPIFARYQTDPENLWKKYSEISSYSMFFLYPVLFLLLLCSREIISLLYGNQWESSLFTFQWLLVYTFLSVNYDLSVLLFNAIGKPEQNLRHFSLVLPFAIIAFYIGASYGGLYGLTLAALLMHSMSAILMMFRLKNYFQWALKTQMRMLVNGLSPLLFQLPLLLVLKHYLLANHLSEFIVILVLTAIMIGFYLVLSKWINSEITANCIGFFIDKVQAKLNVKFSKQTAVIPSVEA